MANEAITVELLGDQGDAISYTVADGNGIEKGTFLTLSDPRTAAANSVTTAAGNVFAGIAAAEKVASDGSTKLAAWTNGVFDVVASGNITVGSPVKCVGANKVMAAQYYDAASGVIVGTALETATDLEVFQVKVQL